MKLLLESWNKFLEEQKLNEMTDEEKEYLRPLLDMPIEDYLFSNIFGNSYRIIEPVSGLKEKTPLANAISVLNKLGWQVDPASNLEYHDETKGNLAGKVKSGKILCSKTKVSHYIDGKGNQGTSRKSVVLNLPKVLAGIINFVKNSRDKIQKEAGAEHFEAAKRHVSLEREGNEAPADIKYSLPAKISDPIIKHTANEYRKIMKFYDAQVYWLGTTTALGMKEFFSDEQINFESFENFSKYATESFDDLIRNMDQYIEKNYIIYSRHPVDVFRMSDHQQIKSCHSPPSGKGKPSFDEYNKCLISEAFGNGMIAYIVPAKDFKMFPPTQESLDKIGKDEIFYDERRPDDSGELIPTSRIRIKHVAFQLNEETEPIKVAVPQGKIYGPKVPGFVDTVSSKMATIQKQEINNIIKTSAKVYGDGHIKLSEFTRYGGSYQDAGYSVAQTMPELFRRVSEDVEFHGSSVRYEPDVEEALMASIGQNEPEIVRQRLNEIFDDHTGGLISFDWEVDEDYDGSVFYRWKMFVTFIIDIPDATGDKKDSWQRMRDIRSSISQVADSQFDDFYKIPETDNIYVTKYSSDRWKISLQYNGADLGEETMYLSGLDENLPNIVAKMGVFDYYEDAGPIQLIEFTLEENGVVPTERYKISNVMEKYDLPDSSWWLVDDTEMEEHFPFGGEYISSISFMDKFSYFPHEAMEKIPENLREAAYQHIADFINLIVTDDANASKLAYNKSTFDPVAYSPVVIMMDSERTLDISVSRLKEIIEGEEEIEMRAGIGLYNDYPNEMLQNAAKFLEEDANIDEIAERFEAQLEKYLADKLKGQQNVTESKKRVRIHVRRQ